MSVGKGQSFEKAILYLPLKGEKTNPGTELTQFTRVTDLSHLAICDTNRQVTLETLKKIGKGNTYSKRRKFDEMVQDKDIISRQIVQKNITNLDDVSNLNKKTFDGGCKFLLNWYNSKTKQTH